MSPVTGWPVDAPSGPGVGTREARAARVEARPRAARFRIRTTAHHRSDVELIQVTHTTKNGKTYANITSIMRLPRGMPKLDVLDYVRVKDRQPEGAPDGPPPEEYGIEEDDDLPF